MLTLTLTLTLTLANSLTLTATWLWQGNTSCAEHVNPLGDGVDVAAEDLADPAQRKPAVPHEHHRPPAQRRCLLPKRCPVLPVASRHGNPPAPLNRAHPRHEK